MEKFLMICYVAAEFDNRKGLVFRVEAKDIGLMIQAPAWIKDTLLFKGLLNDGSITTAKNKAEQKKLENDPLDGVTADGKAETAASQKTKGTSRKKKTAETAEESEIPAPEKGDAEESESSEPEKGDAE